MLLRFTVEASDRDCDARAGRLVTGHGEVETPVFMPVGTQAAVRALVPEQLHATGARIVLANTYHLALRPGQAIVEKAGGLHAFMAWDGPILTDSGGFQVFSLPGAEVQADGVLFKRVENAFVKHKQDRVRFSGDNRSYRDLELLVVSCRVYGPSAQSTGTTTTLSNQAFTP